MTGLSTTSGPASGGTTVTVTGSGFGTGTPVVDFGTVAAHLVSSSPTSVTVSHPEGDVRGDRRGHRDHDGRGRRDERRGRGVAVHLRVAPGDRRRPRQGADGRRTRVTVVGSGFTGVTAVDFGTVAATSVHVVSSTSLTAVAPPGPSGGGSWPCTVTAGEGTSPATRPPTTTTPCPGT